MKLRAPTRMSTVIVLQPVLHFETQVPRRPTVFPQFAAQSPNGVFTLQETGIIPTLDRGDREFVLFAFNRVLPLCY